MITVDTVHTGHLESATLAAIRTLLDEVFAPVPEERFTDDDWDHAVGGLHAVVREGADVVGHASLVQRRLLHGGRALRTGYVEAVAVRADRQGRGYGTALLDALEPVIDRAYDLGALSATDRAAAFYRARGWHRWGGRTFALTPRGVERTADEDAGVHVRLAGAPVDLTGDLTCDWRDGEVW
jgi:aminoglycoside 2'-N-acetyltransferase I